MNETKFKVIRICIDGLGVNGRVVRMLLTNKTLDEWIVALRVYFTFFDIEGKIYFILFCIVHVIKCVQNNLLTTLNYFNYPSIQLPDGHSIPSRICDIEFIGELYK